MYKTLNDITQGGMFCDGDWIEKKDQNPNGSVRLIQLADIGDGIFRDKSSRFITAAKAEELKCTFLKKNDILIARLPDPLGRACIFPLEGKFITAVDVAIVRISDKDVSIKYIMHLINSPFFREQVKMLESGTTRKRISRKNLAKIKFKIPDLHEQERIVARIEELFSELDKAVETLQKTKQQLAVYRQAVLKEAFEAQKGWRIKTADQIGEVKLGRQRSPKNISSDYPTKYIRAANITETGLDFSDVLEMNFNPTERSKFYLKKGDILLSEASGSPTQVGKPAIWNYPDNEYCFQNTVIRHRVFAENPLYVYWYYKYMYISGRFSNMVGGVGINHLGASNFSKIVVPLPPYDEQVKIAQSVESNMPACDNIEKTVDTALKQAEAMRQSILKKAFEGELA